MDLFAAVDIRGGVAVRLTQGDFARQAAYGDPVALARRWADAGARWIHVVDLDAARTGRPANRDIVLAVAAAVGCKVQAGGGIRSLGAAAALLDGGVDRVVLGTAAVDDPELLAQLASAYPGRIVAGVDHRGGGAEVAVSGWEAGAGVSLGQVLGHLDEVPLAAVVVTAIERDGTLRGPDLDGLVAVLEGSRHPVVASGGVRDTADLLALAAVTGGGRHLAGVIVGKALVEGALDVEEALAVCGPSG